MSLVEHSGVPNSKLGTVDCKCVPYCNAVCWEFSVGIERWNFKFNLGV